MYEFHFFATTLFCGLRTDNCAFERTSSVASRHYDGTKKNGRFAARALNPKRGTTSINYAPVSADRNKARRWVTLINRNKTERGPMTFSRVPTQTIPVVPRTRVGV